ncbi:hypothetical protein H5410_039661 [Solanum commersonii]|uniref:Uncharacterized protein n=1 Tax=Solanum commersonii TaxID=4109 RepID=A0A9J5XLK4_SOLCO|nr:hypothetical protein H5410_039661 [Solanum commersonii]
MRLILTMMKKKKWKRVKLRIFRFLQNHKKRQERNSLKPGDNAGKSNKKSLHDVAKEHLRERAVAAFSRWKPATYHEVN